MNRLLRAAAALLCAVGLSALGQGVRYDSRATTVQTHMPVGANAPVLAIPGAQVWVCSTSLCTTPTNIYQDQALTVLAANPITAGGESPSNLSGSWGFWAAPGTYYYKITTGSSTFGPYPITLGGSGGGSGGFSFASEIPAGVINGSNPTFTLSNAPVLLFLDLNGVQMTAGVDFSIVGSTITMTTIPQGGGNPDKLYATYLYGTSTTQTPYSQTPVGAINGSNTAFTLDHTPVILWLTRNGIRLQQGVGQDFTISGNSITMAAAPQSGDVFNAQYLY